MYIVKDFTNQNLITNIVTIIFDLQQLHKITPKIKYEYIMQILVRYTKSLLNI